MSASSLRTFARLSLLAAPLLVTLSAAAGGQSTGRPTRAALVAAIDSIAGAPVAAGDAAAIAVAVVRGARDTIVAKGYGLADIENQVAATPRHVFEIGSVTKQFTAVAILRLVEQGKLSLDDDLSRYLPDFPLQGNRVTIRQLLNHTSGIRSYTGVRRFGDIAARDFPHDSVLALIRNEPFDFVPGERMLYNNSAYFLLGLVIEKVTGKPYGDHVRETLFAPLGMTQSRYCDQYELIAHRATGYDRAPQGLRRAQFLSMNHPYAAGSLCSTVLDLVTWNRALHGGSVLSPASYAAMIAPGSLADGTPLRYGMGLMLAPVAGHRQIGHGGDINGFTSASMYLPDDSLTVVVLINTEPKVRPDAIAEQIVARVLGRATTVTLASAPADLQRYVGTFAGPGGATLTLWAEQGVLKVRRASGSAQTLAYEGGDAFSIVEAPRQRLTFRGSGARADRVLVDGVTALNVLARQP